MGRKLKQFSERGNSRRASNNLKWLLLPFFALVGLVGGAIGGVVGPTAIAIGITPEHFILLFVGIGSAIGILPGLVGGIVAVCLNAWLSDRGHSLVAYSVTAMAVFGLSAVLAALTNGYLYLVGLSAC